MRFKKIIVLGKDRTMKFMKWMGTRTECANGQVVAWFIAGLGIGFIVGILFMTRLLLNSN